MEAMLSNWRDEQGGRWTLGATSRSKSERNEPSGSEITGLPACPNLIKEERKDEEKTNWCMFRLR